MRLLAIILILSTSLAWASPLAELPDSHWAYGALRRLEGANLLDGPFLSGLTRYEAAMKVVEAQEELKRIPPDRSDALLRQLILSYLQEGNTFILTEGTSLEGRARILSMDLLNLREEFAEELAVLDPPASPVEDILTTLSRLAEPAKLLGVHRPELPVCHRQDDPVIGAGSGFGDQFDTLLESLDT